jgi:ribose transport system ATP-binding protein
VTPPLLAARSITKCFGAVTALRGVDFAVAAGEVVAIVGENGAGKSTLMNVLAGITAPDAGELRLRGEVVRWSSPAAALRAGIALIHQQVRLCTNLTVAEAIALGQEPRRGPFVDRRRQTADAVAALAAVGLDVSPGALVGDLSCARRRRC